MQRGTKVVHRSPVIFKQSVSWLRLRLRVLAGKLYNLAGIPGIVRDCDYSATICDARIRVRSKELFTIITVNDLDIYFHRLTGSIDGVGLSTPPGYCKQDEVLESGRVPVRSSLVRGT